MWKMKNIFLFFYFVKEAPKRFNLKEFLKGLSVFILYDEESVSSREKF